MQTPNAKNGVVLGGAGCYRVVKEEVEVEVVVPCCSDDDDDDDDDGVVVVAHSHSKRSNNEITAGTGINSIWEKLDSAGTQKDIYTECRKPRARTRTRLKFKPKLKLKLPDLQTPGHRHREYNKDEREVNCGAIEA